MDTTAEGEEVFADLIRRHRHRIYGLACRMLGDRVAAEDATQEILLLVYRNLGSFRGASDLYTWVYAVARNHCLRLTKKGPTFEGLTKLLEVARAEAEVEGLSEEERTRSIEQVREGCLLGLLRCLDLEQRVAFVLVVLLGVPAAEVAQVLEKSVNATRILASRARSHVREFLCQNCSVYVPGNPCSCRDLVAFSLKQGWIDHARVPSDGSTADAARVASEVDELKRLVRLYDTLPTPPPPNQLAGRLREALSQPGLAMAEPKKVK